MKVMLSVLSAAAVAFAGFLGTRSPESESARATFDGCLRTGSAPSVFILRGGRQAGTEEGARDFLLVAVSSGADLNGALNHQVSIDGNAGAPGEGPEPPAAANSAEKALRRLSVQALRDSGQRC
jgi:hypothetical protein